jgi:hypothetical protein
MTTTTIKTILFASLIAAMILPFSGMQFADAKSDNNTEYDKLSTQIDKEIVKFVKQSEKFSDNPEKVAQLNEKFSEKKDKLIAKYQDRLDNSLASTFDKTDLASDQRKELVSLIISEKFKAPMQEKFVADMLAENEGISVLGYDLLPSAYAACTTQPDVTAFKQLNVDITGQIGFNGGNGLETVQRNNLSTCLREYTLTFSDEDHPVPATDLAYDLVRIQIYGTIKDVEKFYVSNGDVWFLDTGSKSQSFWTLVPTHYQDVNSFSSTVYVSNTWNHMMDTSNTNSGAPLTTWYK